MDLLKFFRNEEAKLAKEGRGKWRAEGEKREKYFFFPN